MSRLPKFFRLLLPALLATIVHAQEPVAQDVLFMRNGDRRPGKVIGFDDRLIRFQVSLILSQPPATVTVPRANVNGIEFASSWAMETLLQSADASKLPALTSAWNEQQRFLAIPKSPAAAVGIAYSDLLLRSRTPENAASALEITKRIEKEAWDSSDRALAKQVRLRAMVATGQAKEAVGEALLLAKESEDPQILIEAKYILAQAAEAELRKLEEENPRWQQDINVRPERQRLVNEAIDLYLYPYLFYGSDTENAARGLWGAVGIYKFIGEIPNALESARDLVALYPATPFNQPAGEFIASLPPEITQQDNEKDAKEQP